MKKLPKTLSGLLNVALKDLRKVEADDEYRVWMDDWHQPIPGSCLVCLAGAVMAKTCKANPKVRADPFTFGQKNAYKFQALNSLREGDVGRAWRQLQWVLKGPDYLVPKKIIQLNRPVVSYTQITKEQFHEQMQELYRDLRKAKL